MNEEYLLLCKYISVCPDIKKMKETGDEDLLDQYLELCNNIPTKETCILFREFCEDELEKKLVSERNRLMSEFALKGGLLES